jgi:hypothetical protein
VAIARSMIVAHLISSADNAAAFIYLPDAIYGAEVPDLPLRSA